MALVLVNYIEDKSTNTFTLLPRTCVLATEKVAILNTEIVIKTPLIVPIKGRMTVVDKDAYEAIHKQFCLKVNKDGTLTEDPTGMKVWLPKDTNVSDLRIVDGELVKIEPETVKPKPKKES